MPGTRLSIMRSFAFAAAVAFLPLSSPAQGNPLAIITQLSQAISGGLPVTKISLSGTATVYAGSITDTGSASLYADLTGKVTTQLSLDKLGARTETLTAGPLSPCSYSGADGVSHIGNGLNCWRPTAWFFPALSLQPSSILTAVSTSDLGRGLVGGSTYRHLQSQLVMPSLNAAAASQLAKESTADIGLDTTSFLPAVMTYTTRPDSGAATLLLVAVHYSNYQNVSGVQIPFHIERYVNGSLQLSITLSSAQIN